MNVTKKSVEEEWVWQSESLDLVCLYIYIYINYLIIEKHLPNKFLTQVYKKKGFSNSIMESCYKIYQGKILSISKSVSQSGPKIYNHSILSIL